MDSTIDLLLRECESKVLAVCRSLDKYLVEALTQSGADPTRLRTMATTASRTCCNAVRDAVRAMKSVASETQRDLNRSLVSELSLENVLFLFGGLIAYMLHSSSFSTYLSAATCQSTDGPRIRGGLSGPARPWNV